MAPCIDAAFLERLKEIADLAGQKIMDIYAKDFASWSKADDSPVTEADLRADQLIRSRLQHSYPDVPIVSEEADNSLQSGACFFLVDPLDGTKEFLKRNGEFTVNIALIQDGFPVAGIVSAPALDVSYVAAACLGAYRLDKSGRTALTAAQHISGQPLRVIGSRSHSTPEMEAWLGQLTEPYEFLPAGSSLKFCRIAEGAADIYPRFGPTSQWDTAAGQCILESAQGSVTTEVGERLGYGLDRPMLNPYFIARGRFAV